jgi:hypothetical protein
MFNLKPSDPLDGLIKQTEAILGERSQLLETIARAETRLGEAEAELTAARERVSREEFENAQKEGGLAIASEAAQQVLVEAELKTKSARFRLQGLRAGSVLIEERLAAAWSAVESYRADFRSGKINAAAQEFDDALKLLVRLIHKARMLSRVGHKWSKIKAPFHPMIALESFQAGNPYTGVSWARPGGVVKDGERMVNTKKADRWRAEPEVAALYDAIDAINQRVNQLGVALRNGGMTVAECHSESDDGALPEEPAESSPEAIG